VCHGELVEPLDDLDSSGNNSHLPLIIASFLALRQPLTCFSKAIAGLAFPNTSLKTNLTGLHL
jgi:hypothetical protein